ncbi:MAG: tetratricopeptide repeat protein, partial [Chthoniobacterales bacterium]
HADRYTYLPQIGLLLAIGYGLRRLTQGFRARLQMMTCVALVAFLALGVAAWRQTQHWKNSHTLWTHAAAVTRENEVAENNLGILLQEEGKLDEAIAHYQRAVAIQTERGHSRYKLTLALSENNLGNAFLRAGNIDQAIAHYRTAIDLRPDYADAFYDLAIGLSEAHDLDGAIESLRRAIDIRADDAAAHARLGDLLRQKHAHAEALVHYEKAVELQPTAIWAEESLAWLLATAPDPSIRNGARALSIAQHTLELPGGQSGHTLRIVAAACATQGNFPEATRTAERAIDLASREGDVATLNSLRADLELYRANIPLRELSPVQ